MKLRNWFVIILKKKHIILLLLACIVIAISCIMVPYLSVEVKPKGKYTIVIDAGHGGRDGGSTGKLGSVEKELNLQYAKTLQKMLNKAGVNVVMTRNNDDGLYDEDASNKKLSDMRARRDIIRDANPDLVVSIHMNSYPLQNCWGAKTFYKMGSDASFDIAKSIQNSLKYYTDNASNTVSAGDYYILNCTEYNSVLVECGFISNPEEERLLMTQDYCDKLMYSVYCGIMLYLGF